MGSWESGSTLCAMGSSCRDGEGGDQDAPAPAPDARERPIRDAPLCIDKPPRLRVENQLGSSEGTWGGVEGGGGGGQKQVAESETGEFLSAAEAPWRAAWIHCGCRKRK